MTRSTRHAELTILDAIDSPSIWGGWFRDPATWRPWRSFLSALFGLPVGEEGTTLFQQCTGCAAPRTGGYDEAWLVVGRRGGKSMILALIACYLAVFRDWRPYLSPGEIGTVKIVACDRRQARVIHKYCRALLTKVPAFAQLIDRETDDEIALNNSVTLEIQTASFRGVRGYTCIAALLDELSFWRSDETSSNPDAEIIAALRPSMATIPHAMFLAASSPYARRGELYNAYRRYHGRDDAPALIWQAPTRVMNSTVPQRTIDEELERDPAKASAEYLAQFRSDIESFISREIVAGAVVPGRHELPRLSNIVYRAFVDAAGGSGSDSMTLAISHRDRDGNVILDCLRERRPPFSPEAVTNEFAATLKSYGVRKVSGDYYAGQWPQERFRESGIQYETSDKSKSDIYLNCLPLLNSGKIELLDHPRLINQLCGLERRTARSGKDSIDHMPGSHDDIVNAACGALLSASHASAKMILPKEMLDQIRSMPVRDRFSPNALGMGSRDRFARSR